MKKFFKTVLKNFAAGCDFVVLRRIQKGKSLGHIVEKRIKNFGGDAR